MPRATGRHSRANSTRMRLRGLAEASVTRRMPRHGGALSRRASLPKPRPHGAARLRQGDAATSNTRCPICSTVFARRSIRVLQAWPTNGTGGWASTSAIPIITHRSSHAATRLVRRAPRRCCCSMSLAISTAFTRISMVIWHSRFRWRPFSRNPASTSLVAVRPDRAAAAHAKPR